MPITTLPVELLLAILFNLPSQSDRQSLRCSTRGLYTLLPQAILCTTSLDAYLNKTNPTVSFDSCEQVEFLRRLYRDFPPDKKKGKIVCPRCRKIVPFVVATPPSKPEGIEGRRCRNCGLRRWFMRETGEPWKMDLGVVTITVAANWT